MSVTSVVAVLVGIYLAVAAGLYLQQRRMLYFPADDYVTPQEIGLEGVEEVVVSTNHTKRLLAWYAPARPGRPTILYFHGNAGSLASRGARLEFLRQQGYGVLMTTYRGYSGSSDSPAELPIKMDALYFFHWLLARGVEESRIVIYGESLGTGVAVSTALDHRPGAVVLEAPYSSVVDVAAARFPWLPVRLFMLDRYDSDKLIGRLEGVPVLIVHGEKDKVIPIRFAKKLFDAAHQPKEAAWLSEAAHNDIYSKGGYEVIHRFIERQFQ